VDSAELDARESSLFSSWSHDQDSDLIQPGVFFDIARCLQPKGSFGSQSTGGLGKQNR